MLGYERLRNNLVRNSFENTLTNEETLAKDQNFRLSQQFLKVTIEKNCDVVKVLRSYPTDFHEFFDYYDPLLMTYSHSELLYLGKLKRNLMFNKDYNSEAYSYVRRDTVYCNFVNHAVKFKCCASMPLDNSFSKSKKEHFRREKLFAEQLENENVIIEQTMECLKDRTYKGKSFRDQKDRKEREKELTKFSGDYLKNSMTKGLSELSHFSEGKLISKDKSMLFETPITQK